MHPGSSFTFYDQKGVQQEPISCHEKSSSLVLITITKDHAADKSKDSFLVFVGSGLLKGCIEEVSFYTPATAMFEGSNQMPENAVDGNRNTYFKSGFIYHNQVSMLIAN